MDFPQYRKFQHNRTFFKLKSPREFDELNIIGNKYLVNRFSASVFPDFMLINDMLENRENRWEIIEAEEYNRILENCQKEKERIE